MNDKNLNPVKFTFGLEGKSADEPSVQNVVQLEDGDLLIEGWGANFDLDREGESFTDNAFSKGLAKFLEGPAPLNYHHKMDVNLGRVVSAEQVSGKGVKIRAVVRNQSENSPHRHIYEGIRRGDIASLSVGGIFERVMTPTGPKIDNVDILEWSTTPVSVGRGTNFSVIAGKAVAELVDETEQLEIVEEEIPEGEKLESEKTLETPEVEKLESEEETTETPETPEGEELPSGEHSEELLLKKGSVTGEYIAPGSIEVGHLSDNLRSSFSELKPETPSLEAMSEQLTEVFNRLDGIWTAQNEASSESDENS